LGTTLLTEYTLGPNRKRRDAIHATGGELLYLLNLGARRQLVQRFLHAAAFLVRSVPFLLAFQTSEYSLRVIDTPDIFRRSAMQLHAIDLRCPEWGMGRLAVVLQERWKAYRCFYESMSNVNESNFGSVCINQQRQYQRQP
jgi:hypothetical protein